jgi:hypothetical protein
MIGRAINQVRRADWVYVCNTAGRLIISSIHITVLLVAMISLLALMRAGFPNAYQLLYVDTSPLIDFWWLETNADPTVSFYVIILATANSFGEVLGHSLWRKDGNSGDHLCRVRNSPDSVRDDTSAKQPLAEA